ncbi:hypothetical protein [Pseudomonas fluorescens]|uniref:hypothetical protein n=1 Tax=Pseudomonas fluorescens TaxID=294 RepID=UPI0007D0B728|nr:hypothetical protein [Pseudomonas fluorescens]
MQLPESLQPWREWLEWFAPEQLPLFADLLGRLNPVLGPLRGVQQGGVPEPDGLGDLQRRGPYDRLLTSEWLLADEVPDEFLRRAAVGEHLFLAPQYRGQQASRLIVALFDAGPLQLGAARLVHMALLILLARRAKEAGAELRWGILQQEPVLHEVDSAAQLKRLLSARTFTTVGDGHWQTWRSWLRTTSMPVGECWLVGQRLPVIDGKICTHRVQVARSLDGSSLSVQLQATDTRRVRLPMPDERLALQLLKGQFEGEVVNAAPTAKGCVPRVALTRPPVISSAGSHVALKMLDEPGMVVIKLPAPYQKKPLEVRRNLWSSGRTALTALFFGRAIGAVLSDSLQLTFWSIPGLKPVDKPGLEELGLPPGTACFLPAVGLRGYSASRLFLLDTQGHLAFWIVEIAKNANTPGTRQTHRLATEVIAIAKVDADAMAYVRREGTRLYAHSVNPEGRVTSAHAVGLADGVSQVLFAASYHWRNGFGGCALLTVKNECESWRVVSVKASPSDAQRIDLARGWKGIGLLQDDNERYSLLMISPGQQAIALWHGDDMETLFTTSEVIAKVSFCPLSGLVAVLTSARELLVYAVPQRLLRLQVICNEKPENKDASHA